MSGFGHVSVTTRAFVDPKAHLVYQVFLIDISNRKVAN